MKSLVAVVVALCACSWSSEGGHHASAAGEVAGLATRSSVREVARSDELIRAQAAIEQGHPWLATQIVAPLLRDPATRTPAALLVAARAAAGWDGWAEVDKLLGNENWLDTQFDGEGRELLARSALDRAADTAALTQASAALRDATGAADRATRQVLLARALERNNMFDSAAVLYGRASDTFRSIRDWLALRVAGNESDSAKRGALLASISLRGRESARRLDRRAGARAVRRCGRRREALRVARRNGREPSTPIERRAGFGNAGCDQGRLALVHPRASGVGGRQERRGGARQSVPDPDAGRRVGHRAGHCDRPVPCRERSSRSSARPLNLH